jgi:CDP-archaeol synthase
MNEFLTISYLLSPLLAGLAFHGFCIRFGWLSGLARPIDAGATLRGRQLFGANKSWRGVIAVALGTAAGFGVQSVVYRVRGGHGVYLLDYGTPAVLGLGFAVGAAAMLSELPNSMLKRQLGLAPGAGGRGVVGAVFYVLDQIDMLMGVWVVLGTVVAVTVARVVDSIVFLFVAHQLLTVVGYGLGMRATAR